MNKVTSPADRQILHIDFDSYFASCEQQLNPDLRGKPIGVTATNGRTCIIAASREAKRFGVKSVTRVFEAQQVCPEIITVPAHFEKYWEITQKFLDICKDYSPYIELFSLDEVFMDITATENLFGGKVKVVERIKERIKNEIGEYLTVSVGVSYNKLLAKLGSGLDKPNGMVEITEQNRDEIYKKIDLMEFCGIGRRINLRLNRLGIHSALELRATPLHILKAEFGNIESKFLKNLSLGIDDSPVILYTDAPGVKSVGRNYCLPQNQYDQRIVFQNVYELSEEIAIKLRRLNKKAKTAFIYLGGSKSIAGSKTTNEYFDSGKDMFNILMQVLKDNSFKLNSSDYIRRISVGASTLEDFDNITLSLFETENKNHKLLETIDKINEKHGDHTIRNGFLLYADKLKTVPNGWMADTYERTKLADNAI